jgi:hypothetical protein
MSITIEEILRSVTATIDANVLPETPAGWPASYLRSAVMLLTYAEDRVRLAPRLLAADNRDLAELLARAGVTVDGADDAAALNEQSRAALCDVIKDAYAAERTPAVQGLIDEIAAYRAVSLAREEEIWRRAETLALM